MADYKSKKLISYITGLFLCSVFLIVTFYITQETPLLKNCQNNACSPSSSQEPTFALDKDWAPLDYALPPDETLLAIEKNIIIEPEYDAKGHPAIPASVNRVLLTAVVNSGMLDYTMNWIESLKRTDQDDKFLVFAIDQGVVDHLVSVGYGDQVTLIPDAWFHVRLASDFAKWQSTDYRPITHAKSLVVERLLYLNVTVWFTDVDIVFLSPFIRQTMLVELSQKPNTQMLFSQEVDLRTVNSGFYMMKPTNLTKQLMRIVVTEQDKPDALTQQKVMNTVLREIFHRDLTKGPYRLLNLLLFPNGNFYFRMDLPMKLGIKPLMVHANYLIGDRKKESLQAAGLWYISP
jgi:hypothetical protein